MNYTAFKATKFLIYTIWETGIHMKSNVAVHPDIPPTNLTPSSESFPLLACKSMITKLKAYFPASILSNPIYSRNQTSSPKLLG